MRAGGVGRGEADVLDGRGGGSGRTHGVRDRRIDKPGDPDDGTSKSRPTPELHGDPERQLGGLCSLQTHHESGEVRHGVWRLDGANGRLSRWPASGGVLGRDRRLHLGRARVQGGRTGWNRRRLLGQERAFLLRLVLDVSRRPVEPDHRQPRQRSAGQSRRCPLGFGVGGGWVQREPDVHVVHYRHRT